MAKFFDTSQDIMELAVDKFEDTGIAHLGVNLKVMSVPKGKEILSIKRANATAEFIAKKSDMVTLTIYEEAFDRLGDEYKTKLMEGVLSNISYDTEKEKLLVDNTRYGELFRMRRKYPDYQDILEAADIVVKQIAEEEKQRKEDEKARKAEERAMKRRNNG